MAINICYKDGGKWNAILNALPQSERAAYKLNLIASVQRQNEGDPKYVYIGSPLGTPTSPWGSLPTQSGNLVGRWILNESSGATVYDTTANANGLWLGDGPYHVSDPQVSQYVGNFIEDGTNVVSIATTDSLSGNVPKSITTWLKSTAVKVGGAESEVVSHTSDDNAGFGIGFDTKIYGFIGTSGKIYSNISIVTGQWYNVVLTYDGAGNAILYVNGQQASTGSVTMGSSQSVSTVNNITTETPDNIVTEATDNMTTEGTIIPTDATMVIGQSLTDDANYFIGHANDIRLYDVALSSQDVLSIYNGA